MAGISRLKSITGVVASGGESSRMGNDKGLLRYHGKEQMFFAYELLETFCEDVFISCRPGFKITNTTYKYIFDAPQYSEHGPISGLLSVAKMDPGKSILFIGCDYPFITVKTIERLIKNINSGHNVVSYRHPITNYPEPLLALYHSSSIPELINWFAAGNYSLKRFLETIDTKFIFPENEIEIKSVDTQEEFEDAIHILNLNNK